MTKQSFAIGGFWYHVSLISSDVYRDQHNNIWIKKDNRFYSECGGLVSDPIEVKTGWVSADDMFIQERENWASYFNNRYYKNL
jgi:hypothetical protein